MARHFLTNILVASNEFDPQPEHPSLQCIWLLIDDVGLGLGVEADIVSTCAT